MTVIQASLQDLTHRGQEIQRLLRPISKAISGPAFSHRQVSTTTFRIATHDGSPPTSDYRSWRFTTIVPGYQGNYFEIWEQLSENRREQWCLHKAYLSIYETDRIARTDKEFLCLHCDPNEPDEQPHAGYKKGPHLHISIAPEPLCHAHIALDGGHLTTILESIVSLTKALQWAIKMLREEVFDAMSAIRR